jgi:hypothetical protein
VKRNQRLAMTIFAPIDAIATDDDYGLTVSAAVSPSTADVSVAQETVAAFEKGDGPVLREMSRTAAGLVTSINIADGFLRLVAKVIDPGTIAKIKHRVLRGFEVTQRFINLVDFPGSFDKVSLWKAQTMDVNTELAIDDHGDAMNHVDPVRLTGEPDFTATLGRVMSDIAAEASERLTIAMDAALRDIKREVDGLRRRADELASDPGARTGLRSPQGRLSSDPEPGTRGAASNIVSLPAIRGQGAQDRNAREVARPFTKANLSLAARAMLTPSVLPGEQRGGGLTKSVAGDTEYVLGPNGERMIDDPFTKSLARDVHAMMSPNAPRPRVAQSAAAPSYGKPTSADPLKKRFLEQLHDGADAYDMLRPNG